MKYIPEMQNKRDIIQKKRKEKQNISTCDCVTCRCHLCDNVWRLGWLILVSILQRNKEVRWSQTVQQRHMNGQRRRDRTGPGHVMLSSLLWKTKTMSKKKKAKQYSKKKKNYFDSEWPLLSYSSLFNRRFRVGIFRWYGPLISWSGGQIARKQGQKCTYVWVPDWLQHFVTRGALLGQCSVVKKAVAGWIHNAVSAGGVWTSFNDHQSHQLVSSFFKRGRQVGGGERWRCRVARHTQKSSLNMHQRMFWCPLLKLNLHMRTHRNLVIPCIT